MSLIGRKKKKYYVFSKILIMTLSLILLFNGLGLIVAGRRVKKRKWVIEGVIYIVVEWVLAYFNLVGIASLLYFVSIVHTALICHEYGLLLQQKEEQESSDNLMSNKIYEEKMVKTGVEIKDLQIEIGSADIHGEMRDKLNIDITDKDGKIYHFKTDGNQIISFKTGVGTEKSYV